MRGRSTLIHVRIRRGSGQVERDVPLDQLHALAEDTESLIWLDLESPSEEDLALVAGIFSWSHLTVEDVTKQGQRAKLEGFQGYSYLVMHDLVYDEVSKKLQTPEVDFVVSANYVATVHYHPMPGINNAREVSERSDGFMGKGADYLLYVL